METMGSLAVFFFFITYYICGKKNPNLDLIEISSCLWSYQKQSFTVVFPNRVAGRATKWRELFRRGYFWDAPVEDAEVPEYAL